MMNRYDWRSPTALEWFMAGWFGSLLLMIALSKIKGLGIDG